MSTQYAVFCSDPLNPRSVEPDYLIEMAAAREAGFVPILIDHDALDHRTDAADALRKARIGEPGCAVYRGWMLRSDAYHALYDALSSRGVHLLTDPPAYDACHHAPGSYEALKVFMPETEWVNEDRLNDHASIKQALASFGTSPVVLKDWVKSQAAGYWSEACFIPDAANFDDALRVIERFIDLQGDSLIGGLVFKRFVPLQPAGKAADEYRAFVVDGQIVGCWPRSPVTVQRDGPPADLLAQVAPKIPSPFASADFSVDTSGRWWLLEVGDGQVSGLPSEAVAQPLFRAMATAISRSSQ